MSIVKLSADKILLPTSHLKGDHKDLEHLKSLGKKVVSATKEMEADDNKAKKEDKIIKSAALTNMGNLAVKGLATSPDQRKLNKIENAKPEHHKNDKYIIPALLGLGASAALLYKYADEQRQGGIAGFSKRHPYLTAGVALTGGLAAADAGLEGYKALKAGGGGKFMTGLKSLKNNPGLKKQVGSNMVQGLKEGTLYGSILGSVEPAIGRGLFRKPKEGQ